MEVQFHLLINDPAQAFDQDGRLVLRLASALDFRQWGSREDGKRCLMDDLVSRVQFGNDEVHGGSVGQHAMFVRIFVRRGAGERRQQAVVQIEDAPPANCQQTAGGKTRIYRAKTM